MNVMNVYFAVRIITTEYYVIMIIHYVVFTCVKEFPQFTAYILYKKGQKKITIFYCYQNDTIHVSHG